MEETFYEKNNLFCRGSGSGFVFLFREYCSLLQGFPESLGVLVGCSSMAVDEVDEDFWTASLIVSRDRQ